MLPKWLGGNAKLRWNGESGVEELDLGAWGTGEGVENGGTVARVRTADGFGVSMEVSRETPDPHGGPEVARVEVRIDPPEGRTAVMAGAQVVMPVDPALVCVWKPHLAPEADMAIGDKAFRSPAIVFEDGTRMAVLVPDLHHLALSRAMPHVMDYAKQNHELTYGLSDYEETGHVYYRLRPKPREIASGLRFRFYLVCWDKAGEAGAGGSRARDFRRLERFLWERFATRSMAGQPLPATDEDVAAALEPYVGHAYGWAFDRWRDLVWQQFELDGSEVGGVVFIATARQKPGLGREDQWREPKSLWNQAWFCGLRTAYGYGLWGLRRGRADWREKAELALNFALSAPQRGGLFPGYYQAGDDGSWETGRWYMSGPRRPAGHEDYVHLLDSSWTCLWLLKWYEHLKRDPRILPYVRRYAEALLELQREDGAFPAWVRPDTKEASPFLAESPESALHAALLCRLHRIEPDERDLAAAR